MGAEDQLSFTEMGMPTYLDLSYSVLQAVQGLGGSARVREINDWVIDHQADADRLLEMTYPSRPSLSVLKDRIAWGRSTAKLIGALDRPSHGVYIITELGEELLSLRKADAAERIKSLDADYAKRQRLAKQKSVEKTIPDENEPSPEVLAETSDEDDPSASWKTQLLERLHQLTPEGFEKYVIYLLRRYGLELTHRGGSGDEGIDAIGTAPLSPVLSSRVAVQVKRYDPNGKPVGRETVALFQRDALTAGAERAILVTLSRFTEAARKAANSSTPTVDLINGDRLAELIREDGESGVKLQPTVQVDWFSRFD